MDPSDWIRLALGNTVLLAVLSWMGRTFINRRIADAHERLKSELTIEAAQKLETFKNELATRSQRELETFKNQLGAQTEGLRHELQLQMLRAQLATTKTQEVYSQLIQKLRKAQGMVGALIGFSFDVDLSTHSAEDLRRVLTEARTPGEELDEVLRLHASDRREAVRKTEQIRRRAQFNRAREAHVEANNHVVLEGVFMSKPVKTAAVEVLARVWGAWVDADVSEKDNSGTTKWLDSLRSNIEKASAELERLEDLMREDLFPATVLNRRVAAPATATAEVLEPPKLPDSTE